MNNLSTRLKEALAFPPFLSAKKSIFFHPSSASVEFTDEYGKTKVVGSCLREQYYRITQEPSSNVGEVDHGISADIGNKVSELIVNYIDTNGYKMGIQRLAVEHSFYDPRINVSGRSDIIAWDYKSKEPIGIEIKSVGEYKAGKCITQPSDEHIMQATLYLDYYRTFIPKGQIIPKKWYIWYVSRTENYSVKSKKHGSPLTMLWDYYITLGDDGVPTVHANGGTYRKEHLNVNNIHSRFKKLLSYVNTNMIPPRDFNLEYSEEYILFLHSTNQLTRKADIEKVDKWLKKGAPQGKLGLTFGDFECNLCSWKDKCWNLSTNIVNATLSNLPDRPQDEPPPKPEIPVDIW